MKKLIILLCLISSNTLAYEPLGKNCEKYIEIKNEEGVLCEWRTLYCHNGANRALGSFSVNCDINQNQKPRVIQTQ